MNSQTFSQQLRRLIPLTSLSETLLAELVAGIEVEKARRGEFLFHQGDQDALHVYLLSGTVAMLSGGREVETLTGRSNTARFPLCHEKPRQCDCQAQGPVSYLRIDSTRLNNLVAQCLAAGRDRTAPTDPGDWMAFVLQSSLFQQLPPANVEMILDRMQEVPVKRGEVVIRQGETGDYYFVVIQGQLSVSQRQNQRDIEIAQLGPGASFGEDALISGYPRNSTVTALTDGSLVRLRKDDFVALIQRPLSSALSYPEASRQAADGAVWMDVRAPQVFERGHLANAVSVPFEALRFIIPSLNKQKSYILYGDQPHRNVTAAFVLKEYGFGAMVLDNGLEQVPDNAWRLMQDEASSESHLVEDSQLASLQQQLQTLQSERSAEIRRFMQAFEKGRAKAQELEKALVSTETARVALEREKRDLVRKLDTLEAAHRRGTQSPSRDDAPSRPLSTEPPSETHLRELERLRRELQVAHKTQYALESALATRGMELEQGRRERDQAIAQLTPWEQRCGQLSTALTQAQQERTRIEAELTQQTTQRVQGLTHQIETARLQIADLVRQRDTALVQTESLRRALAGEAPAALASDARLSALQSALLTARQETDDVRVKLAALQTHLQKTEGKLAHTENTVTQTTTERDRLKTRVASLESIQEQAKLTRAELDGQIQNLARELATLAGSRQEWVAKAEAATQRAGRIGELEQALDHFRLEFEKAAQSFAVMRGDYDVKLASAQREIDNLRRQLAQAREEVASLHRQLAQTQKEVASKARDAAPIAESSNIMVLRRRIAELEREVTAKVDENALLTTILEDLERELHQRQN
ncbi:hypothetical protein CCP4SC76_1650009 [Gammaproteobacteria bacterium]